MDQILHIEKELQSYYETDYDTEKDDYVENLRIKSSLSDILRKAQNELSSKESNAIKSKILLILAKNTGCAEDIEILNNAYKNILNETEIKMVLSKSGVNRWS